MENIENIENCSIQAVEASLKGRNVFCKFLSANDIGQTGSHQSGIYIPKNSYSILFDNKFEKGQLEEKWVKIKWQNDFEYDTRFVYYGQKTRNEYRITNFGRGFPFFKPEYTGALFVLIKNTDTEYSGFVLNTENEINYYLDAFGISATETNRLINIERYVSLQDREEIAINSVVSQLNGTFPKSVVMSQYAREIQNKVFDHSEYVVTNPDKKLIDWTEQEFRLFRALEFYNYNSTILKGFKSIDEFLALSNQILNRRKSRAGKSLENHLSAIFDCNGLQYKSQAVTEGNKKPDFLFPSIEAYKNSAFPQSKLATLAAKTTCKDRWRQIINEADRLRNQNKFLCTLQQGISVAQIDEMKAEKVVLVVPKQYLNTYPKERQSDIWTLTQFIDYIKSLQI